MIRRETFIALRARRTSYRIANDVLHPPFDLPTPALVPLPIDYRFPDLAPRPLTSTRIALHCVVLALWLLAALAIVLATIWS